MILLFNVFITDTHAKGVGAYQNREMAKSFDKLDIYKYSLASLANVYPWKKVIINTKLDEKYSERREELNNFIREEFGKYDLLIRDYRNETQEQWQKESEILDDKLIWYSGNHDHVYIDNDYQYLFECTESIKNLDGLFSMQFSHWPEFIFEPYFYFRPKQFSVFAMQVLGVYHHSLQIISKELYEYYWFSKELPKDQVWGRTDNFFSDAFKDEILTFVPTRELCRHFDGYQHCPRQYQNDLVPVLEIPDGFFEKNIKINVGLQYKEGYTNCNPYNKNLKIFSTEGTDFWYSKDFIPKFWLSRVSELKNEFSSETNNRLSNREFAKRQLHLLKFLPEDGFTDEIKRMYLRDS